MQRRNHLIWIGPPVVFAGFVSYYLVFVRFPTLRDFPWLNLPVIWAGMLLSLLGLQRAFARGRGKVLASLGLAFSLLVAGFFHAYVFWISYQMPGMNRTVASLTTAPDFTLSDQRGRPVTLSDFRGRNVVLVFYRGHW